MDKKTGPINMLPLKDPPQIKRYTQTKGKGLEKGISCKWKAKNKKIWGSNTYVQQIRPPNPAFCKRQRRTLHSNKGNNPTRGYNPSKHLHTQHRST